MPFLHRATEARHTPLAARLPELEWICRRLERTRGTSEAWIPGAVKAYVMLSMEFLMLQKKLEKSGRYLLSSERESFDKVYNNPEVFTKYYLDGLLLSEALWPNQYLLNRLFSNTFLPLVHPGSHVVEVGVGTGYHLRQLLKKEPNISYTGFDISTLAIQYCRQFTGEDLLEPRGQLTFHHRNISRGSELEADSANALILGEILEHVENPASVLEEMRRIAQPGIPMFMTTVIFTANIDHIYLFEKADDIRRMTAQCGWKTFQETVLPIYPDDHPDMERRPMNYGTVLIAD